MDYQLTTHIRNLESKVEKIEDLNFIDFYEVQKLERMIDDIDGKLTVNKMQFGSLMFKNKLIARLVRLCVGLGPCKTKRNLRFLSNFNHNTVRLFQASFCRLLGVFGDLLKKPG